MEPLQEFTLQDDMFNSITPYLTQAEFQFSHDAREPTKKPKTRKCKKTRKVSDKKKEILSWARVGTEGEDEFTPGNSQKKVATRKVGLSVNVTEARMLESELIGLSRARYHAIKENNHQKNHFIDNLIRKSKSLPQLLEGIDIQQYRQKSFNGVEIYKARSHRMKVTLLREHYWEYLSEENEEDLRQMSIADIMHLVEERKKEKWPANHPLKEEDDKTRNIFLTIREDSRETLPSTHKLPPLPLKKTPPAAISFSPNENRTPLEVEDYNSNTEDASFFPSKIADNNPPVNLDVDRMGNSAKRHSTISRPSITQLRRRRTLVPVKPLNTKPLPNINDPRCKNLILSLVPFQDQGGRTTSGKTLPDLLTRIDSLRAESVIFSKKETEVLSNRPTPRLLVYQQ